MDDILSRLLVRPGLWIGPGDGSESGPFVGRVHVEVLPSGAAISVDYEAVSVEHLLQHAEHTILARTGDGPLSLLVVHSESSVATVLPEQRPGWFVEPAPAGPYVQAIEIALAGETLSYAWSWAPRGEPLVERSRATLTRVPQTSTAPPA